MVWSVAGLTRFSPQSMQNEAATQTAESAMQSSNCIAMTAMHFLKQKLVPGTLKFIIIIQFISKVLPQVSLQITVQLRIYHE